MQCHGGLIAGPDSKVCGANMEPNWVLLAPDGPHVDPMNLALRGLNSSKLSKKIKNMPYLSAVCNASEDHTGKKPSSHSSAKRTLIIIIRKWMNSKFAHKSED